MYGVSVTTYFSAAKYLCLPLLFFMYPFIFDKSFIVKPNSREYHIEVRIATSKGFRLRLIDTQTKTGRKHRRGLDTLNKIKFTHPTMVNAIKQIFGTSKYQKVLVVWEVENNSVIKKQKNSTTLKYGKCQP